MAVTLSTINTTLVNQNDILHSTDEGVRNTSNNIEKLISSLATDRLGDRFNNKEQLEANSEAARKVKTKTSQAGSGSSGGGLFSGIGGMFSGIGAALASIPILGGFLTSFLSFSKLLLRFGPLAFIIGSIIQGADTEELSRLFTNLEEAFGKISTTISGWYKSSEEFLKENGITLPSLKEVMTFISDSFNGAVKGLNNILEGDFKTFGADMADIGITLGMIAFAFKPIGFIGKAFALLAGALGLAKTAATSLTGAAAVAAAPTAATAATAATAGISGAALGAGAAVSAVASTKPRKFKVDKAGNYTSIKTGKPLAGAALKTAQATTAADAAAVVKKFPRFGALSKFASKIPLLGGLISAGLLANVLMGDGSKDDKIKGVSGILGGISGAGLGALVGSLVAPGIGTIAGAVIGGLSGDLLATSLAEWLLGGKSDTLKSAVQTHELAAASNVRMDPSSDPRSTTYKPPVKPVPQNAAVIGNLNAQGAEAAALRSRGMGNGAPIVIQDNSVRSSSNNSALALPPLSSVDTRYNVSGFIR